MYSPDLDAVQQVKAFAQDSLGLQVKVVPYKHHVDSMMYQQSLDRHWVRAGRTLAVVFLFTELYATFRYNVYKGYEWYHLPFKLPKSSVLICFDKNCFCTNSEFIGTVVF